VRKAVEVAKKKSMFRSRALVVSCRDQHRSAQFYEGVLGAVRLPGDGYGCVWLRLGSWDLSLMPNSSEAASTVPPHAGILLMLEVDDLQKAHQKFINVDVEIREPPNGPYMLIADPDGLQIEVWQTDPEEIDGASHSDIG
jgi:hypothetical protein